MSSRVVVLIGLGWLITATAVGAAGLMSTVRPSALPLLLLGLTTAVLAAAWRLPAFRGWLATIDERWLVGLHLTRFVGATSCTSTGRDSCRTPLPCREAGATSRWRAWRWRCLAWGSPRDARRRPAYVAWNVLGLADIVFVVATAGQLAATEPESMAALLRLPLSLLPTFLVPLIIASHVVLGVRLTRREAATSR